MKLLQNKVLQIGYGSWRIENYIPVIRPSNCQSYDHSSSNCKNKTVCPYCAIKHSQDQCHIKDNPHDYRCINCLNTSWDFPHSSNSSNCPYFQNKIQQRNTTRFQNSFSSQPRFSSDLWSSENFSIISDQKLNIVEYVN